MNWYLKSGLTPAIPAELIGACNLSASFKKFTDETLSFRLDQADIDADPIFQFEEQVTVLNPSGKQVFVGVVTKTPVRGSGVEENQYYTLSGPWYWFTKLPYQQRWITWDGVNNKLVSTLQTGAVINQGNDNALLNLGDVVSAILAFILSAPLPNASYTTPLFAIGENTLDTEIPFTETDGQLCSQTLISVLQWVPDAVGYFDHSVTPPVFHIKRRAQLQAVNLPAFNSDGTAIVLDPRYDLLVKGVICKYKITSTFNGQALVTQVVRKCPANAPDPGFDVVVLNLDLIGSNSTTQSQTLTVTDRPLDYNRSTNAGGLSAVALSWLKASHRADWLKGYTIPAGAAPGAVGPYSHGNSTDRDIFVPVNENDLEIVSIVTTLSDAAQAPLELSTGKVLPGAGPGTAKGGGNALDHLSEELLDGTVQDWMKGPDFNIFDALCLVKVTVRYTGSDPVIQARFSAGPEFLTTIPCTARLTNGSSQEYTQPTGNSIGEAIPDGLEKDLFDGLSVLHYEGTITLEEDECTGQVNLGNVVNLTGSKRPEWATMNAQIDEITMDIDNGTTVIHLGPPAELTGQQRLDIIRADRNRKQASTLSERNTGTPGDDNKIAGTGGTAMASVSMPPAILPQKPWEISLTRTGGGVQAMVNINSNVQLSRKPKDTIPVTGLGVLRNVNVSGIGDQFWLEGTVAFNNGVLTTTAVTVKNNGNGDNGFSVSADPWTDNGVVQQDGNTPPMQNKWCLPIGLVVGDLDGNAKVKFQCNTDLIIKAGIILGKAALYPEPVSGIPSDS